MGSGREGIEGLGGELQPDFGHRINIAYQGSLQSLWSSQASHPYVHCHPQLGEPAKAGRHQCHALKQ